MPPPRPASGASERLASLDVLRGLTLLAFVFGSLCATYLDQKPGFDWLTSQMQTREGYSVRLCDLLQPALLFLCGVALPFSLANRQGQSFARFGIHILLRTTVLLGIGLFLDAYHAGRFDVRTLRLSGPLQQIALAWFLAVLVAPLGIKVQLAAIVFLLSTHTAGFYIHGKSVGIDPWTPGQNVGSFLDQVFGLATSNGHSTLDVLPSTVLVLLGAICGDMMRGGLPPGRKAAVMTASGLALLTLGWALSGGGGWVGVSFPSITPMTRKVATASCTVWSAGWVYLITAVLYLLIEVMLIRFWTLPFVVAGMNSLFLYISFTLLEPVARRSIGLFLPERESWSGWQPVIFAGLETLVFWSACFWLYRKKAFFKI